MKAMKPRVAFQVPNTLTGEGNINVDITFESMDDFSPAAVARKVDALNKLLEARQQLSNLITYMDGKTGAEELVGKLLQDPALLQTLATTKNPQDEPRREPREPLSGEQPWLTRNPSRTRSRRSEPLKSREFASLLQKEFKPKTDEAKEAVEQAVRTLAEQALSQTKLIGADVVKSIEAIIAAARQEADRADQPDPAPPGLPEARGRLARAALSGQQHRNRRDAEDPRHEHHQEGSRQDAEAVQGHGLGPEPAVQEGLRGGVRPVRRRALRLPGRRLLLRPDAARRRSCWARCRKVAAAAHTPVHRRRLADGHADGLLAGAGQSARPDQDLHDAGVRRPGGRCASRRTARYIGLAMPRFLARLPYGAKTNPVEEFDFEEDTGAADHSRYTWANSAYAMAANINRSFKLYGWCSRIRGVESGGVGRRPAGPHLPDRRRRRGHEVPDRDRHQRPARGGAGQERLHAAHPPQELGFRRVHRRAVAAEAVRVRRSGRDRQRQSVGAAAVSVRVLPLRALPEVHRARQDRLVQGARRHAASGCRSGS